MFFSISTFQCAERMAYFSPLQGIDIIFLPGLEFLNGRQCYLLDNSIQILDCTDTICLYGEIIINAHSPKDLSILIMFTLNDWCIRLCN